MKVSGYLHASVTLSGGKDTGTYWVGGWVGPRAILDILEKDSRAITGIRTPDHPAHDPVPILTTVPCICQLLILK